MRQVENVLKVKSKAEKDAEKKRQLDDQSKATKEGIKKFDVNRLHWIWILVIAIVAALAVRYVVSLLFADSQIGFVWLEIIKLIVSFMILIAIASIAESSKAGVAVAIFIVIFSVVAIVNHDYPERVRVENVKKNPSESITVKDSVFTKGTYFINVKDKTPFVINVQSALTCNKYSLASQTGNGYNVVYVDGTMVYDAPGVRTVFPNRPNPRFKLMSNKLATIKMVVN